MPLRTAQNWFRRFKDDNFNLKDMQCTRCTVRFNEERLNRLIHEDPCQTTRELAVTMECSHSTLERHLHSMGKVQKLGPWVPHALTDNNRNQQATITAGLLARHQATHGRRQRFLYRIVTGDEKWCLYINMKQRNKWLSPDRRATPQAKQDLHLRKTMCVWWYWKGMLHYELLDRNKTVTAALYVQQMQRLHNAIRRQRPDQRYGLLLQHKARPHINNMTKETIQTLGWEVLPHPPYSPDLAPSDYHLFRTLLNALRGISFSTDVELRAWLDNYFDSKPAKFYRRGIDKACWTLGEGCGQQRGVHY